MSIVLGAALAGFGESLVRFDEAKKEAALEKLQNDRALENYRAKKEIDEEFSIRKGGRKVSGGGRRGSRKGSGPSNTKRKSLTRGMVGDIQSYAEEQGWDEKTTLDYILETERLKGAGLTENEAWNGALRHGVTGSEEVEVEGSFINRISGGLIGRDPTSGTVDTGPTGEFQYPEGHAGYIPSSAPQGFDAVTQPSPAPAASGPQAMSTGPAMAAPETPATSGGPAIGAVVNGYRFKGGNPNDQAAWESVG